jgi:hypothetical protein
MKAPQLLTESTGEIQALLPVSKIKVNVDHAGLSQPLVPLRESEKSRVMDLLHTLSNKWLTVHLKTTVAVVDGHISP